jgi:hypothetical protein
MGLVGNAQALLRVSAKPKPPRVSHARFLKHNMICPVLLLLVKKSDDTHRAIHARCISHSTVAATNTKAM